MRLYDIYKDMKTSHAFSRLGMILMFALTVKASLAVYLTILPLHLTSQAFSPIEIGLLIGAGNLIAMTFAPYAGSISNRISKRVLLTLSGLSTGFSLALFAIVNSPLLVLLATILLTISSTFLRLGLVVIVAAINAQRRASAMGLLNVANSLGSSLGFVLVGWIADKQGYAVTFLVSAVPITLVSIVAWTLSNWLPGGTGDRDDPRSHSSFQNILQTPKKIALPILFLLCDMGITFAWQTFMPIYLVDSLGWSVTLLGELMAARTLVYLVCQPLSAYLADRIGYERLLVVGLSGYGILISSIALTSNTWLIFVAMLINAALASPIYPTSLALAAEVPQEERGTAMGFMLASSNLAGVLGPMLAGLIVSAATVPTAGFAYSFIPALTVSITSWLILSRRTINITKLPRM